MHIIMDDFPIKVRVWNTLVFNLINRFCTYDQRSFKFTSIITLESLKIRKYYSTL